MQKLLSKKIEYFKNVQIEFNYYTLDIPRITEEYSTYNLHAHDYYEIFFLISGDCRIIAKNSIYRLSYGDVFVAMPGEIHGIAFNSKCRSEHYFFYIPSSSFDSLSTGADNILSLIGKRPHGMNNIIKLSPQQINELYICCKTLEEHAADANFSASLLSFSTVMHVFSIIYDAGTHPIGQPEQNVLSSTCRDLLDYINANFATIKGLDDIAAAMKMSSSHLSRLFKQHMGINLMKYVREKKFALAKRVLCEGGSVTNACYAAGFDNYSHFITAFRKETGVSPREFRTKVQSEKISNED